MLKCEILQYKLSILPPSGGSARPLANLSRRYSALFLRFYCRIELAFHSPTIAPLSATVTLPSESVITGALPSGCTSASSCGALSSLVRVYFLISYGTSSSSCNTMLAFDVGEAGIERILTRSRRIRSERESFKWWTVIIVPGR